MEITDILDFQVLVRPLCGLATKIEQIKSLGIIETGHLHGQVSWCREERQADGDA